MSSGTKLNYEDVEYTFFNLKDIIDTMLDMQKKILKNREDLVELMKSRLDQEERIQKLEAQVRELQNQKEETHTAEKL